LIRPLIIGYCIYGSLVVLWPSSCQVVCNTLLVETFSWGAQTCFFSNVFYPVICNDYETVVLSLNSSSWSRWEAEAETRGEFRAPDEAYDLNSSLHASSNPDASALPTGSANTVPSPGARCKEETAPARHELDELAVRRVYLCCVALCSPHTRLQLGMVFSTIAWLEASLYGIFISIGGSSYFPIWSEKTFCWQWKDWCFADWCFWGPSVMHIHLYYKFWISLTDIFFNQTLTISEKNYLWTF